MPSVTCVEGDTLVNFQFELDDAYGDFPLVSATAIDLIIAGITTACTGVVLTQGSARCTLPSTVTSQQGVHQGSIRVTTSAGFQFFPSEQPLLLTVLPHTRSRP